MLFLFSLYHLVRDVLQDFRVENLATNFLKTPKNWCGGYCDLITFPFELFILGGSIFVLKRGRVGWLGYSVVGVFLVWLMMFLYDYFVFNHV